MLQAGGKQFRAFALLALVGVLLLLPGGARAQASPYVTVSGVVYFDQNGNGRRDPGEPLLSHVQIAVQGSAPRSSASAPRSDDDGGYAEFLLPGTYTIQAELVDRNTPSPAGRPVLVAGPRTITVGAENLASVDLGVTLPPTPRDARYFPQTGYRIDSDSFWAYFTHRGGVHSFGYPVSRAFPFLGFWTQIFQRQVMQEWPDGTVHLLNLLDPGLMPVTSVNFSTFPAFDPALAARAPAPSDAPSYGPAVIAFVQQHAPDTWNGRPVNFYRTFSTTVTLRDAYPEGGGFPGQTPLFNLELWGLPTSPPACDPHNHNFVYQRFQRGIMHYDAGCNCTQGILLADTFKSVLTGRNVPADVAQEMAASPYLKLYEPTQVDAVARVPVATASGTVMTPRVEGWTDLAFAFLPAAS